MVNSEYIVFNEIDQMKFKEINKGVDFYLGSSSGSRAAACFLFVWGGTTIGLISGRFVFLAEFYHFGMITPQFTKIVVSIHCLP